MTDIFISYARADRKKVRPFAEAFEKKGWQVWLDLQIRSGTSFDRVIEQELEEARCVIVIWSHNSVESDWVRAEAGDGLKRGILVSIAIEQELRLPLRFRNVHTDLLLDLAVDRAPSTFNKIVEDIEALIGRPKPASAPTKVETQQKTEVIKQKEKEAFEHQKTFTNTIGMKFVLIPAGKFKMGSYLSLSDLVHKYGGNVDEYAGEHPKHEVNINNAYYLQTTPVTQGQWISLMGENPSHFKKCGADCPVDSVSWNDAKEFIKRLNEIDESCKYHLPTEAEWEYACRAGTKTEFSFGNNVDDLGIYAWYLDEGKRKPYPVATKKPNPWGLYDMHGNIWEWVEDCWHDTYFGAPIDGSAWQHREEKVFHVYRGGCFKSTARSCRSSCRGRNSPLNRSQLFGFRTAGSIY